MPATKQKPMFHQPRRLSPKVQQTICEGIEAGATLEIAAQAAGIGARTLDEWLHHGRNELQENPDAEGPCADFVRAATVAGAKCESDLLATIQAAAPKNWTAAAWLLERRIPQRYAKVDRLRVSGDEQNNKPVQVCSEEDAKNRLLKKLAAIAERAMEGAGKGDDPVVDEGAVDEDGVLVEESLPRKKI